MTSGGVKSKARASASRGGGNHATAESTAAVTATSAAATSTMSSLSVHGSWSCISPLNGELVSTKISLVVKNHFCHSHKGGMGDERALVSLCAELLVERPFTRGFT